MRTRIFPPITIAIALICTVAAALRADAQATRPSIVELRGSAAALGAQHGDALGANIHRLVTEFLGKAIDPSIRPMTVRGALAFEPKLNPEHLTEIKSLALAAKVDEADILLANTFLDLSPMTACSSISLPADAAPDHVARFARNLDFPTSGIEASASVVIIYHPTDRYGFVTIGWPGMIGALSGMNEYGLTLANMEVKRDAGQIPRAMPYTLLYRTVLERCKTVDEAIALLKETPRQTPNNLMLMDSGDNRAVVELTPESVVIRPGKPNAALISTNHQRGDDDDTPGKCRRYDYLHDTAVKSFGHLTPADLQSMLQHVQQQEMTIQSMIFEPANRVIYLSTGMNAAEGEMRKIELKRYFK